MSLNVVYVGIDVDDVRYHGCALNQHTGEVLDSVACRATLKGLVDQLKKLRDYFGGGAAEAVLRSVLRGLLAAA